MENELDSLVAIKTYIHRDPLPLPGNSVYIAEDLCIYAAQICNIGPISRHLFGLWSPELGAWLSPCHEIDTTIPKKWFLEFKLRFKLPSIEPLEKLKDLVALDYVFRQMRYDFLNGRIPELNGQHRDKALGLAATDMIREMLENKPNLNIEDIKNRYKDFLPREIWKKHRFWLKEPLLGAVNKGLSNSLGDVNFVKGQFMNQVYGLAPEYGREEYKAQIDEDGKVYEVTLQINPFHIEQPGLRMQIKSNKAKWVHICSIKDLYYVSVRKDNTVEVSRRNGIPQYVRFDNINQLKSFVSCLDGYYRLMEKWTFNLCKELPTPSLLNSKSLKCHGPVGYKFSYQKLKEKRDFEAGSYIIRESSSSYEELRVDVCIPSQEKPLTLKIFRGDDVKFRLTEEETTFDTLPQLVTHSCKKIGIQSAVFCVSPSEYDKTRLLLCRPDGVESQTLPSQRECSCTAQCIPTKAVVFDNSSKINGQFCTITLAKLRQSAGEMKPITVKALLPEYSNNHIQAFLQQCSKVMQWNCQAFVSSVGIILDSPLALVLEFLPLGPLDIYLSNNESDLEQVDLVEAGTYLAMALWYLEEQNCSHGKIRCKNIMVASHTENSFKVKLSDSGLLIYNYEDAPWIPPEYQSDYSMCQYSIEADVFAFGTTMWEIFSYGQKPVIHDYGNDVFNDKTAHLPKPLSCHDDVYNLMVECWTYDPDNRKKPQAIMRDVNQTLYEVYNSRRSHSYATVYSVSSSPSHTQPVDVILTDQIKDSHNEVVPPIPHRRSIFSVMKQRVNEMPYDEMNSAYSGSSERSNSTMFSEVDSIIGAPTVPEGHLISINESMTGTHRDNNPALMFQCSAWVIDKSDLTMGQILGQGFYGEVYKATYSQWEGLKKETVAVKRMKKEVLCEASLQDLIQEINIMKTLSHKNIVEIKGLVEEPQTMLVMEYLELGSLLAYLKGYRTKLNNNNLLRFASDIAEGMNYLEEKNIVHRDLAARNILVASPDRVKISDFGLARFTENHYYRIRTERDLPVRWYAPECIKYGAGTFTHKSDVWSYGITLWEMFSYGENPAIPGVTDTTLINALYKGQRLACPDNCPQDVYRIMRECWQMDYHSRPSFASILLQTEELRTKLE